VTVLAEAVSAADTSDSCYTFVNNQWVCGQYWSDFRPELTDATVEHLWLTLASVALGFVIAFPLALMARRFGWLESSIVGSTTIVYTIPSLAMFSILLPFTHVTASTVIIGLALYALTILVRNILAGLRAVPDDARESAIGLGYGPTRLLFKIELPLALPVIMAGLRVATVSTVALVTVGSILTYGGLGDLLLIGVDQDFKAQIFAASVLCVALAIVLDVVLVLVERLLTPWTRAAGRA
jgi:osmoprotectant transport system permease protein